MINQIINSGSFASDDEDYNCNISVSCTVSELRDFNRSFDGGRNDV